MQNILHDFKLIHLNLSAKHYKLNPIFMDYEYLLILIKQIHIQIHEHIGTL